MSFKAFITKTTARARSGVSKVSNTVKLYSKKNNVIDTINEMFDTLGKMTYYNAIGEGSETANDDIQSVITEITRLRNELENIELEISELNAHKKCENCHSELPKDVHYCPNCGTEVKAEESYTQDGSNEDEDEDISSKADDEE